MASENDMIEENEEVYERPRPRRRLRGLHWRHASQSHSFPPQTQPSPQQSPPQIRPSSVNMGQSLFGSFNTASPVNSSTPAGAIPDSPSAPYSYSCILQLLLIIGQCQ